MAKIKLEETGSSILSNTWNGPGPSVYPAFKYSIKSKSLQWELRVGHYSRVDLNFNPDISDFEYLIEMFNELSEDIIKSTEEVDRLIVQSFHVYD